MYIDEIRGVTECLHQQINPERKSNSVGYEAKNYLRYLCWIKL